MIKVTSTVRLNLPKLHGLKKAQIEALSQTADWLMGEVREEQVIPRDKGTLQGDAMFVDDSNAHKGKVTIVHNTPYARRLYFHPEYHFSKEENPTAKGKWLEDWAAPPDGNGKKAKSIRNAYAEIYRRINGL